MSLSRSVALYLGGSCAVLYVLYKVVTPSEDEMRKVLNILGLLQYCYIVKFKSLCPPKCCILSSLSVPLKQNS